MRSSQSDSVANLSLRRSTSDDVGLIERSYWGCFVSVGARFAVLFRLNIAAEKLTVETGFQAC